MNKNMETMLGALQQMKGVMTDMSQKMAKLDEMSQAMKQMLHAIGEMKKAMEVLPQMSAHMEKMLSSINGMAGKMDEMAAQMQKLDKMAGAMDQMLQSMETINSTMGDMNQKMDAINKLSDQMGTMIGDMKTMVGIMKTLKVFAFDLVDGVTASFRVQFFDAMDKAATLSGKMSNAAKYQMAFTFQIWKGIGGQTEKDRQMMFFHAMEEFFRSIQNFYDPAKQAQPPEKEKTTPIDRVGQINEANHLNNLYALAVSLHRLAPAQEDWARKQTEEGHPFKTFSMLDLIYEGLDAKLAEAQKQMVLAQLPEEKKYLVEVARNSTIAIDLLYMRYNVLMLTALKTGTDFLDRTANLIEGGKLLMGATHLKVDPKRLDDSAKIGYMVKILDAAKKVKLRLQKYGVPVNDLILKDIKIAKLTLNDLLEGLEVPITDPPNPGVQAIQQLLDEIQAIK
jgi:hypothetical protein